MKFNNFLNESKNNLKNDIIYLIKKLNTWFDIEDNDDTLLLLTRKHGDMSNDSAGKKDIEEAKRIRKAINKKFPEIKLHLEVVDEWTQLEIEVKGKENDDYLPQKDFLPVAKNIEKYLKTINIPFNRDPKNFDSGIKENILHYGKMRYKIFLYAGDIDINIPREKRAKEYKELTKKLKKDIYKKFNIKKYERKDSGFDVGDISSYDGSWLYLIVWSPYLSNKK